MKFKKIKGSQNADGVLKTAIEELKDLLSKDERFMFDGEESNKAKSRICKGGNCCVLEFFYYSTGVNSDFENAIWIRINENDNIWLYVKISNTFRKKARIFSSFDLTCLKFPQVKTETYSLPFSFTTNPIWYEKASVTDITYIELIKEIIDRLPCVCYVPVV